MAHFQAPTILIGLIAKLIDHLRRLVEQPERCAQLRHVFRGLAVLVKNWHFNNNTRSITAQHMSKSGINRGVKRATAKLVRVGVKAEAADQLADAGEPDDEYDPLVETEIRLRVYERMAIAALPFEEIDQC